MCSEYGEAPDKVTPVILSQTYTNSEGYFDMTLPPGDYCYRTHQKGRPLGQYKHFEVGDSDKYLRVNADSSARIRAQVTAKSGQPIPAKLTVVGTHEYSEDLAKRHYLYDLVAGEPWRTSDGVPDQKDKPKKTRRYREATAYSSTDGTVETEVRPGTYTLVF
ncbi:MAG: hypothetical protein ABEN55_04380, partial [Bradymonadaceae bacterium]